MYGSRRTPPAHRNQPDRSLADSRIGTHRHSRQRRKAPQFPFPWKTRSVLPGRFQFQQKPDFRFTQSAGDQCAQYSFIHAPGYCLSSTRFLLCRTHRAGNRVRDTLGFGIRPGPNLHRSDGRFSSSAPDDLRLRTETPRRTRSAAGPFPHPTDRWRKSFGAKSSGCELVAGFALATNFGATRRAASIPAWVFDFPLGPIT